jgi:hypothetical protein
MGFPQDYINMVKLLFEGARARVSVNGSPTNFFQVNQGVWQGCPLVPYLFLIMREVLNQCIKQEMRQGQIQGIKLLGSCTEQAILQYADDTSLTLRGEETVVQQAMATLCLFSARSGLIINWEK